MATVQYHLEKTPEKEIQDFFRGLREKILGLGDDVEERSPKSHISYKRRGERIFSYIFIQKKAIKIQLTIPHDDLKDSKGISVDVSNKAHKSVKTEIKLKEIDDLGHVFDLVRQCYQFKKQEEIDDPEPDENFPWAQFYESVANKLLGFKDKREELAEGINKIAEQVGTSGLKDTYKDGTTGPLKDICPFTAIGIFNKSNPNTNIDDRRRKIIARKLADFLGIKNTVPEHFKGIPTLHPQKAWFFAKENERKPQDIAVLWEIFEEAIELSRSRDKNVQSAFMAAYDKAAQIKNVGWNLTIGLYWIRPWSFLTLDGKSREYINKYFKDIVDIPTSPPKAEKYLNISGIFEDKFQEDEFPFNSFPELSLAAWEGREPPKKLKRKKLLLDLTTDCFIDQSKLEKILDRLQTNKNLILQGPPGTGKTWLAKRLAFALIGRKDKSKVKALQFHPNLSYEDFVRGWRPAGDGRLELVDGPFLQIAEAARNEPTEKYVIVIEEINRGHPAQILGELLTLLEADKRNDDEALELCYPKKKGEPFFIPENLYVIGTMNIADRSLALVDLALRRRFAFVDLEPVFGEPWKSWVHDKFNIDRKTLSEIETRIRSLNDIISDESDLGPQFRIGHSYVTPANGTVIEDAYDWFRQVVNTEIGPLLDEYWFDDLDRAKKEKETLLQGFQ